MRKEENLERKQRQSLYKEKRGKEEKSMIYITMAKKVQDPWLFQPEVQQRPKWGPLLLQQGEPHRGQRHRVQT